MGTRARAPDALVFRLRLQNVSRRRRYREILWLEVPPMPDILIRNVPADVVEALDANARRAGLSRTEYLRRHVLRDAARSTAPCTIEDLKRTAEVFADLNDPEIMRRTWE